MTRSFVRLRARSLCFLLLSLSPLSPFPPHLSLPCYASRIPSWYIHGHLCLRACSQKWIAHDRRASERANSPLFSFLLAYSVRVRWMCTHTYAFSGFFSPLFLSLARSLARALPLSLSFALFLFDNVDECIEDIVFRALTAIVVIVDALCIYLLFTRKWK